MIRSTKCLLASLAAAAVLTLFSACDKDEASKNSFSFMFDDGSAAYFEFGQTRKVAVTQKKVERLDITAPAGWSAVMASDREMSITAPAADTPGALLRDTVVVVAYGKQGKEVTAKLPVAVVSAERLDLAGQANSYIASAPATRYKFKGTVKGNSSETIAPVSASIVWQSSKGLLDHVSLIDGDIYFSTAEVDEGSLLEGNALIAAMDADDNILWSWHIWVSDYDPAAHNDSYSNGKVFMTRNLGATGEGNDDEQAILSSFGLYYQWGRKEPFIMGASYNSTANAPIYNGKNIGISITYTASDESTGTIEYAVANPTQYLKGVEQSSFDWLYAARDNTLWGTTKTMYDPCPPGWRVPDADSWTIFTTTGTTATDPAQFRVEGEFDAGWRFLFDGHLSTYYPAAGRRSFFTGRLTNVKEDGSLWTGFYWSAAASQTQATALYFDDDSIYPHISGEVNRSHAYPDQIGYRANGYQIRCMKE